LGTDARVRYTKSIIQDTFFKLLGEKPLNKITVKRICEHSEINRTTFYRYYTDPYDLMRKIENNLIDSLQQLIKEAGSKSISETILIVLDAIYEHSEVYTLLVSENGDKTFIDRVIHESYIIMKEEINNRFPQTPEKYREWIYYFLTHGSINIIIPWIQNGMQEDPGEMALFIDKLNEQVIKGFH